MQWWCSATGQTWTWHWQWYPGVDLLLLLVGGAWYVAGSRGDWPHRPWGWFGAAWLILAIALEWPVGKLGAGYLASAHTLQFMLLTLAAGPLLIRSIPDEAWSRWAPVGSRVSQMLRRFTRPIPSLLGYTIIVLGTHIPSIVDSAMLTQWGSLLIDLSWITGGLLLWWPIIAPRRFKSMGVFGTIGYIFGATIGPTIPAMMMVFSTWPFYQLYELAPRVFPHFSANDDLKLAGLCMKIIGDLPLWIAAMVVFFRGTATEGELVDA